MWRCEHFRTTPASDPSCQSDACLLPQESYDRPVIAPSSPPSLSHRRFLLLPAFTALALTPLTRIAAEEVFHYNATLNAATRVNSAGVKLTDPADVLIQERSLAHKNGSATENYFVSPERRAEITALLKRGSLGGLGTTILGKDDTTLHLSAYTNAEGALCLKASRAVAPQAAGKPAAKNAGGSPTELAPGNPVRKAIFDTLRPAVTAEIGEPVEFTGSVRILGNWALVNANAAPKSGKAPKSPDAADLLKLDLVALLRKNGDSWRLLHQAFAGDVGPLMEMRERFPDVPIALVPRIP